MHRDSPRAAQVRARIAQQAARLMAEHGIRDHALAKRKAARQLGVSANNGLPSNEEIDQALKDYQTLFEPEESESNLVELRRQALEVMDLFRRFSPILVGGVAQGTVSAHSGIEMEVYSDSSKEFEQFLLNEGIGFKTDERRGVSFFTLFGEPADITIRVLPIKDLQSGPRASLEPRRRLTAEQLRQLMRMEAAP